MKIIADAKTNHNGNIEFVKRLIEEAFMAGADIISFDLKVPEYALKKSEWFKCVKTPWGEMLKIDCERKVQLKKEELDLIDYYTKRVGIKWMAKVFDTRSLNLAARYDIPYIELSEDSVKNKEMIEAVKENKIHVLIPSSELKFQDALELSLAYSDRYIKKYGLTYLSKDNKQGLGIIKRGFTLDKNMWTTSSEDDLNKKEFKNFILNL